MAFVVEEAGLGWGRGADRLITDLMGTYLGNPREIRNNKDFISEMRIH